MSDAEMILLPEGKTLIKHYEDLSLIAYQDQGGVWTIGWGHTGPDVYEGLSITLERAEQLFEEDCARAAMGVKSVLTITLNNYQFSALVSFTYNLGLGNLVRSTLLKLINSSQIYEAADEFTRWIKVKGVPYAGLLARRQAEKALYMTGAAPKTLG